MLSSPPGQSTKSFILQIQGHKYLLTNQLTEINLPLRLAPGVVGDVPLIAGGGAVGAKEETVSEYMNYFVVIQLNNDLILTAGTGKTQFRFHLLYQEISWSYSCTHFNYSRKNGMRTCVPLNRSDATGIMAVIQ